MKNWISLLLCVGLFAASAACAPAGEGIKAEKNAQTLRAGRYVESQIALPKATSASQTSILGVAPGTDVLTVYTFTDEGEGANFHVRYVRHTLSTDGSVTSADEVWLNELAAQGGNEMHLIAGGDGALYMYFSDYDAEYNPQAHILVSRDGGRTGEELGGDDIRSLGMLTGLGVLDDGSLVAGNFYDGTLVLLDQTGNRVRELGAESRGRISSCAAGGQFVALAVPDDNQIRLYRADEDRYEDYEFPISENSVPQLTVLEDGTVFAADATGLYCRAPGGTLWEALVDGASSTLGLPGFYAGSLTVSGDGPYRTCYVAGMDELLSYTYDATATAVANKELTVFSLRNNDTVRQAIVAFNRVQNDVKVTYTVAMDGAAGGTEQDYIKSLNTELLAGTGPDILLLDGLPLDSYIEKDVLADLSGILTDAEPVRENIVSALVHDGKLYAVPTGFAVPLAVAAPGMQGAFDSLSSLAEASERAGKLPLLSRCAFSDKTLSEYLLQYYGGALKAGDPAEMAQFLHDARRIAEATDCTERLGEGWDALKDFSQDELYENIRVHIDGPQIFACASGRAQALLTQPMGSVFGCMDIMAIVQLLDAQIDDVAGQFVPVGIVGVNKAGDEPEIAAAFVKMLLSYDAQGGNQYVEQFPVNDRALSEMLANENLDVNSSMHLNDGGEFQAKWPLPEQRERLGVLIDGLHVPVLKDSALIDMLLPEMEACLSGRSSVEQAADRMSGLISTYLSE